MDSGIVVQLFLGVLWAIGCALFVTFLLEFREDRSAHSNYPATTQAVKPASNRDTREIGSVNVADENCTDPSQGKSSAGERLLHARARSSNAG
jgi:hypothetical protein